VSSKNEGLYWVGLGVLISALLVVFSEILFPFVAGAAVAYFLNPAVVRADKLGLSRAFSASLVLVIFILGLGLSGLLVFPILQEQVVSLLVQFPVIVGDWLSRWSELVSSNIYVSEIVNTEIGEEALLGAVPRLAEWAFQSLHVIWQSGSTLVNFVGLLFVTPVVSWYLLRDWEKLISRCDGWLPLEYAQTIRTQLHLVDEIVAKFCRGQASICIILAISYSVALGILGLEYGLAVGLVAGIISFVPYVGAIFGFSLAGGLAYAQSGSLEFVGLIAGVFLIGQVVEGYVLTPKLVGERLGLNAVWVLFSLLAGGSLFGLVGVLLAVPVAAIIGVALRFFLSRYLKSSLYQGDQKDRSESEI